MECFICKKENSDEAKFCINCGVRLDVQLGPLREAVEASVKQEVDRALTKFKTDQKIAEFNITETVTARLLGWVKLLGSVLGLLLVAAGFLGIKGLLDLQHDAEVVVKGEADQLKNGIAEEEQRISGEQQRLNNLISEDSKIHDRFAALDSNIYKYEKIGQEYERLQAVVEKQAGQLDRLQSTVADLAAGFVPLPKPTSTLPFHLRLDSVVKPEVMAQIAKTGKIVFQITGNTGSPKKPKTELLVADQMTKDFETKADKPVFLYILGNIVFYSGETALYYPQFYEPYEQYPAPIFAIPGNHDGGQSDPNQIPLDGFMRNFCAGTGTLQKTPEAADSRRTPMIQPFCYWTLETPLVTIVGLYTNVPEGGSVERDQQDWLTNELKTAPEGKALLVCLHHSVYFFDDHRNGSRRMASVLEKAINESRRVPNLILSATTFNYQRIESSAIETIIPFINVGSGGYYNLHPLRVSVGTVDDETGIKLIAANDKLHGYLTLTIDGKLISGVVTLVNDKEDGGPLKGDAFTYPAKATYLKEGKEIKLGQEALANRE